MSIKSFDSGILSNHYGYLGQETVEGIARCLEKHSFTLSYDSATRKFTILNSQAFSCSEIEQIFSTIEFPVWNPRELQDWQPKVLGQTDQSGNQLFELRCNNKV